MVKNDGDSAPKPAANPPVFLAGSRPSFLEIVSSHPSFRKHGAEKKEAAQPELKARPRKQNPLSKSTVRLEQYTRWLIAATLVSAIFCTAWTTWSIYELRNFAFQQAKSVTDSIEISRYGILAANRRAEATEKQYDLAAENSRSQLRAYVSFLGISTQNAFEKHVIKP
jgi:hypothetical protein